MNKQCKGCQFHHIAGHKSGSKLAPFNTLKKHNDWCCKYGRTAKKALGHCRLNSGYEKNIDVS